LPDRCSTPLLTIVLFLALAAVDTAAALDFRADFRSSTFQASPGDSFSDLLIAHQAGTLIQSNVTTGLENISTSVYGAGVTQNYSLLMETSVEVGVEGQYTFQVGTDWGRGGAAALIDDLDGTILFEQVITEDVWWGYDWNDPDVFTTTFDFTAGDSYTLAWVGFEGCCGGSSTIRFSVEGSGFTALTSDAITPLLVPEPSSLVLFLMGLTGLSVPASRPRRPRID